MSGKKYTISEFSRIFSKSKQVVRRRIDSLQIKSVNRDTRAFPNEPLEYDFEAYTMLAKSFDVTVKNHDLDDDMQQHAGKRTSDTENTLEHTVNEHVIVDILERELEHAKEKIAKAEEEKEHLYRLLDQQQQLSLNDKKKIDSLELKLNNFKNTAISSEIDDKPINKKKKKKSFFNRLFQI